MKEALKKFFDDAFAEALADFAEKHWNEIMKLDAVKKVAPCLDLEDGEQKAALVIGLLFWCYNHRKTVRLCNTLYNMLANVATVEMLSGFTGFLGGFRGAVRAVRKARKLSKQLEKARKWALEKLEEAMERCNTGKT